MSFRTKLTMFFVGIVVVPMIAVAVVVFRLVDTSETGQANARLAQGQAAAMGLLRQDVQAADRVAARLGRDRVLAQALISAPAARGGTAGAGGSRAARGAAAKDRARRAQLAKARARARTLIGDGNVQRVVIVLRGVRVLDVGTQGPTVGSSRRELVDSKRRQFATIEVSLVGPDDYAQQVRRVAGLHAVVHRDGKPLGSSLTGPDAATRVPQDGERLEIAGRHYRTAAFSVPAFGGGTTLVSILADDQPTDAATARGRRVVAIVLVGLLLIAWLFALSISRTLQGQVGRFLEAARRLGGGDFSREVPVQGRDEFAQLGDEFNKMSRQLEDRLEELDQERARLREAIRRTGETLASNLDREALLGVSVATAIDAVRAEWGRISVAEEPEGALVPAEPGNVAEDALGAIEEAERAALAADGLARAERDGIAAAACPVEDLDDPDRPAALLAVARRGPAFSDDEAALLRSIAAQVAASLENVKLHELVRRQAVTDELTGLSNHRRFQEVLTREVERAKRHEQPLALVMVDVDRFKLVNDTYGHQQGDAVLRAVANVLRDCARDVDEPARYGGEEMAVALPNTDAEGGVRVAERIREAIAALEVPRLDGEGVLQVTASFGVAALPVHAEGKEELVAAADAALYEAKRGGRNRTCTATVDPAQAVRAE